MNIGIAEKDITPKINEAKISNKLSLRFSSFDVKIWIEIIKLSNLEELDLSCNELTSIPEEISNLKNLKIINLSENKITSISLGLTKLSKLEELNLYENELTSIPEEISNLKNLKIIDLGYNKLKSIPFGLTKLPNLEELNLLRNELISISKEISNLKNLKIIHLGGNKIKAIPIGLTKLPKLEVLELWYNQLTSIPEEISNLKNLKHINLDGNKITSIPIGLTKISKIEALHLEENELTSIPEEISNLKNLKNINLISNKIRLIPIGLTKLPKLENIGLYSNSAIKHINFWYLFDENYLDKINYFIENIIEKFISLGLSTNSLQGDKTGQKNFNISFETKNKNIFGFIRLFVHNMPSPRVLHNRIMESSSFRNYENRFIYSSGISINIFGEEAMQKNLLTKLRTVIETYLQEILKENNFNFIFDKKGESSKDGDEDLYFRKTSLGEYNNKKNRRESDKRKPNIINCLRFFNYFYKDSDIIIDYDQLLTLHKNQERTYSSEDGEYKLPIHKLLEFIHEDQNSQNNANSWPGKKTITKFTLENFKIFKNHTINFSRNINIILGNNGIGKTSLLQALSLSLLPNKNIDRPLDLNEFISFEKKEVTLEISWEIEQEKIKSRRLNFYENDNLIDYNFNNYPPNYLVLAYGVNFNTNESLDHDTITDNLIKGNEITYFTKSIFSNYFENLHNPIIILKKLYDKETENEDENSKKIIQGIRKLILDTLNRFLSLVDEEERLTFEFNERSPVYRIKDFLGNELEFKHLSEGYKDHLLLLTDIIVRIIASRNNLLKNPKIKNLFSEVRGAVIIDEFDRHLHPKWQRQLTSTFKEVFKNLQFFLTTHNPMSIIDRTKDEIINLVTEQGKDNKSQLSVKYYQKGTEYTDISEIYLTYFMNIITSEQLRNDITEFNRLFIKNKKTKEEEADFENLQKKLSETNMRVPIYDKRYWMFIEFLKKHPALDPNEKNNQESGTWNFTENDWQDMIMEFEKKSK